MADQQISISLPEETLRTMQARVDSGEYASLRDPIVDSVDTASHIPMEAVLASLKMDRMMRNPIL